MSATNIPAAAPSADTGPRLLRASAATAALVAGVVILAFDVDTSGRAINIRIVRSLGLGLDEKAITAVTRWKFRPAVAGNKTVGRNLG